jgi:MFS family permease
MPAEKPESRSQDDLEKAEHPTKPSSDDISESSNSTNLEKTTSAPGFPDGGVRAWLVVLGGWCTLFASFGWIMCMGVFQDWYEHHILREYSANTISWIPSMQICLMFLLAPIFGKIFDSYGPRCLLYVGSSFQLIGVFMLSLSETYTEIMLAQGLCSAIGTSAMFYAGNNTVSRWFLKHRALAIGLVSSGSSAGGLVGTYVSHLIRYGVPC